MGSEAGVERWAGGQGQGLLPSLVTPLDSSVSFP